ncbi:hypothetical protein [Microbacterium sp. AR7-10]|uniref:hypothetical protein n=1 Tax=Microbacterium sp. AR7-10 TaxID=1891970 RepID=UPI0008FC520C|nr:hypothetical protein [Microbacterium sp. AR7-10]OIU88668.1 hypothetical protein BFN01_04285 [Microbacterium sp. AR7-10]
MHQLPPFAEALTIEWGTVPDWVAAIGTVLAFVVAAVAYAGSVWLSREAQARQVSMSQLQIDVVEAGTSLGLAQPMVLIGVPVDLSQPMPEGLVPGVRVARLKLTVVNNSDEVMGPVSLEFAALGARSFLRDAHGEIDRIQPHETATIRVVIPDHWYPMHPPLQVRMVFRDSAGRWWQRFENERVRSAPRRIRPAEHARKQAAKLSRATSVERTPAPKAGSGWRLVGNVKDGVHVAR